MIINSKSRIAAIFALAITLPSTAGAAGIMETFCLSQGETAANCTCSQTVADKTLSPADQTRFVTIAADPSAFFAMMSGQGVDEAFLGRVTAFSEQVEAQCQ